MKYDTDTYIAKASEVHKYKYNYGNTIYTGIKNKIDIICPIHGKFTQIADNHLQGKGCIHCGYNRMANEYRSTLKEFVYKASIVHDNKYTYDKVVYNNAKTKVIITCPIHGDFDQEPHSHLIGNGCNKCANENSTSWDYKSWIRSAEKSKDFDSYKVYIIKVFNDSEEFIKIGRTFRKVSKRFGVGDTKLLPYQYTIIKVIEGSAKYIHELEQLLHLNYTNFKYKPKKEFKGINECYKDIDIDRIK